MCQEVRPERKGAGIPYEGSEENLPSLHPCWLFWACGDLPLSFSLDPTKRLASLPINLYVVFYPYGFLKILTQISDAQGIIYKHHSSTTLPWRLLPFR